MRLDRSGMAIALAAAIVALGAAVSAASSEKETGDTLEAPLLTRLVMDNVGRLLVLRSDLGVTDDQKNKIRTIVKSHRSEIAPAITTVYEKRKALREVMVNSPAGQEAIRTAAADLGKAIGDASIVRARVATEIRQVLTPQQQDRMKKFRADLDRSIEKWFGEFGK